MQVESEQRLNEEDEEIYDKVIDNYEESRQRKLRLLDNLPKLTYVSDSDLEKQFNVYMDLSKKDQDGGYFISAFNSSIKNKKEYLYPEEILEKTMKIYNLEEYGSNFNPAIYDPKKFIQDQENTYDNLARKQLEYYSGGGNFQGKPIYSQNNNQKKNAMKTFWDAGPGSFQEVNKNQSSNSQFQNIYNAPLMNPMDPLAMIAKQNKAFVEKNK